MEKKVRNKIHSTAILTDIRNFSRTFKKFQNNDSDDFLMFLENYFLIQDEIASCLADDFFMSSTGDGVLSVFMDENHYKTGYAYILASSKVLDKLCRDFENKHKDVNLSYGIGADSGNVWKIGKRALETYVGTVINRASRIESKTKEFSKTTVVVGNSLYKYIVRDFFPEYFKIMEEYESYDELINENPEAIMISKQLLLYYIFDMPLKGIDSDASIFRLSPTLSNSSAFWILIERMVGKEKMSKLKEIVENC